MYDELDLTIMAEELTRLYGEKNAKEIMLNNKDNLFSGKNSVAYSLGKRSIRFFSLHYLRDMFIGDGKAELSNTHYDSWIELTEMFYGKGSNKRNYLFPRGFGKTAILSTPTVIWAHCYGFSTLTVLGSAVKDTSTAFMMSIKEGFSGDRLIDTFGELMSEDLINNTEKLELANDSMIMVASTRTTLRGINYKGNRINLLVLDDYMSEENTSSTEAMDKHWNLFQRNALPAVEKDKHWVLGFGTTQVRGDFYDRLSNDPTFITRKSPAINSLKELDSKLWVEFKNRLYDSSRGLESAKELYEDNKEDMEFDRIWDYFSCMDLAVLYFTDESAFRQEYQLEFADSEKEKFTNIVYHNNDYKGNVLAIDPATSSNKDNDYTAFVVGGMVENIVHVSFADIQRLDFDDYIKYTVEILKANKGIETVIVEKQTYNRADVIAMQNIIQRDEELKYRDIEWINEHQSKNKDNKIDSIVGDVNLGRVQFNEELRDNEAIEQLKEFKTTKTSRHDDFPDVLSELVIYLKENNLEEDVVQLFDIGLLF